MLGRIRNLGRIPPLNLGDLVSVVFLELESVEMEEFMHARACWLSRQRSWGLHPRDHDSNTHSGEKALSSGLK